MHRILVCCTLLILTLTCLGHAQTTADSLFKIAQAAYDNGDFDISELVAMRGLRLVSDPNPFDRLKFHLLLGFVYVARDQRNYALEEFDSVLIINPRYDLDPIQTAPKILEVFRDARKIYMDRMINQPAVYRMPQADVRLAASWRSAVLPGWGQVYKKQDVKGAALASAQLLSLAALIAMQIEVNHLHSVYLGKKSYNDPTIESAYSEYRRSCRTRNVVGYVALGIYVVNYLDALYTPVFHNKSKP
jgi:hypothetical protein